MTVPVIECFCMWSDLLGFGNAFQEGNWSFQNDIAEKNIARLQRLESSLYTSNDPSKEVALVLNDGLARIYDLPKLESESSQFLWWLHLAIANHWLVNANDQQFGNPGLRSVLTFGERVRTWRGSKSWGDHHLIGSSEMKLFANKKICIYSPEEFQLNLAFSKAYIIDSLGKKGGLAGPGLYVDVEALVAIENFLTSQPHNRLCLGGIEKISSGALLNFSMNSVSYRIEKTLTNNAYRYEIFCGTIECGQQHQVMAVEFLPEPIAITYRGIDTSMWRVKRYQPIDEEESFYFDFEDFRFQSPETKSLKT